MTFFSCNVSKCVSMNNQECKIRLATITIQSNRPSFYLYSILVNKFSGRCNNINDSSAKLCVTGVFKDMNNKIFNVNN